MPIRGQSINPRLAIGTYYLQAKFGESVRRYDCGLKTENGPFDPDQAPLMGGLISVS